MVQKYDSKTNEWTEAASMLIPRSGSAACVLDKYIYVIGMIRKIFNSRLYLKFMLDYLIRDSLFVMNFLLWKKTYHAEIIISMII